VLEAVTFDFWNTVMWEEPGSLRAQRLEVWPELLGRSVDPEALRLAHDAAHTAYEESWRAGRQFTVEHAAGLIAERLTGVPEGVLVEGFCEAGRRRRLLPRERAQLAPRARAPGRWAAHPADRGRHLSACAGAALYRRDAFLEAGGFDESFFCYIEDSDLAFRLRLRGHRCGYVPQAEVLHIGSALAGVESDFTVYHSNRNLVWAWVKNMPSPLVWIYLPQHLLVNALMLLLYALKGQGRPVLAAKRDALRGLPRVLRARSEIQSRRAVEPLELRRSMSRGLSAYQGTRARGPVDRLLDRLGLLDRRSPSSA
jgi:hypothetical protein